MNIDDAQVKGGLVLPWKKPSRGGRPQSIKSNRLPLLHIFPHGSRAHIVATAGEFVGTFLFLFFALSGTQVANTTGKGATTTSSSTTNNVLFIALCFGFSLAVNAWVFFRISGGLFNPAVTLGMCLVGAVTYFRGLLLFFAQLCGAISAAAVVSCLFPGPLTVTTNLGAGTSVVQGLFIEMFLTAGLVFTIFMLAAEKHKATFIAPLGIGLSLFIAELTGVLFTGGSLNPARSIAPAIVNHSFHSYHWIYWVGPILGSLLAASFYKFIKMLEYETANPGQDEDEKEHNAFNPDRDHSAPRVSFDPGQYRATTVGGRDALASTSGDRDIIPVDDDARTSSSPVVGSPVVGRDMFEKRDRGAFIPGDSRLGTGMSHKSALKVRNSGSVGRLGGGGGSGVRDGGLQEMHLEREAAFMGGPALEEGVWQSTGIQGK